MSCVGWQGFDGLLGFDGWAHSQKTSIYEAYGYWALCVGFLAV